MKYFLVLLIAFYSCSCQAQPNVYSFHQLEQLDSIGHSPSISRHFAQLYFQFLQLVESRLKSADSSTQRLVRNFEAVFAQFYIDAAVAWKEGKPIRLEAWRTYFADSSLQPIQYKLLGANAHLNGGLAAAIAGSYSEEEWSWLRKKYYLFDKCLNQTYRQVYSEALLQINRARALHLVSLGFDRPLGNYYLYKWRKRQMRLAKEWYAKSDRYIRLSRKIARKKNRIDQMVLTQLYR